MNQPKERPIIFSGPMVRAIIDGQKTQTRRVLRKQPPVDLTGRWSLCVSSTERKSRDKWSYRILDDNGHIYTERGRERCVAQIACPFGLYGDHLWVRETWANLNKPGIASEIIYRADDGNWNPANDAPGEYKADGGTWKSPLFMPRWASRLLLEVKEVRIELLQDITLEDSSAEGVRSPFTIPENYRLGFMELWNRFNRSPDLRWSDNPWVWVIGFRVIQSKGESHHG